MAKLAAGSTPSDRRDTDTSNNRSKSHHRQFAGAVAHIESTRSWADMMRKRMSGWSGWPSAGELTRRRRNHVHREEESPERRSASPGHRSTLMSVGSCLETFESCPGHVVAVSPIRNVIVLEMLRMTRLDVPGLPIFA